MELTPRSAIAFTLCVAAAAFAGGAWWSHTDTVPAAAAAGGRRILYYHCPMHPAYKSDKPGSAPCCGMDLEPVYADGQSGVPEGRASATVPGTVRISMEKQQLIGVRISEIQKKDAMHEVRLFGRVAVDEGRIRVLNAPADGIIRELSAVTSGSFVEQNQVLATFLSRESVSKQDQQSFLSLLGGPGLGNSTLPGQPARANSIYFDFARDTLRLFGMSDQQIEEFEKSKKLTASIQITSPMKGLLLARNVSPGLRFDKGFEFYRIADLSSVWVLADVFENDARILPSVSGVTVRYQGHEFPAQMSKVTPQFDPDSRTLKVRLEVPNPAVTLRPDMFVDAVFRVNIPAALVVPIDAVLDSGIRKTVFVERGGGQFEPRAVQTGARFGDQVVITSGLTAGERIVTSGNFLIDSESRLQLAASAAMAAPSKAPADKPMAANLDPVCGMTVDPGQAKYKSDHAGHTYYFCSPTCKADFDKNPAKYTAEKHAHAGGDMK